ncbi:olfactory receptor 10A7-like [Mauremys mutica]|uniref:olfactory receptor 10A7-like n=1 Tax=Mauremys mutica TaxID=74926 RepID=UPI001D167154|nr:olfactory receptor 10A7-like [Mauremys mutica]
MLSASENQTVVKEFVLVGFASISSSQGLLFALFLAIYMVTLAGNGIIITLTSTDPNLDTPMYYFLRNLSVIDICYISSTVPQLLVHFLSRTHTISMLACATQNYAFFAFGVTECFLLAVMSYDRYVAICNPLHYTVVMSHQACAKLAVGSWVSGFLHSVVLTVCTFHVPFCGPNRIDHFFCEAPQVLKLACADTYVNELVIFAVAVLVLIIPLSLVFVSYSRILATILQMSTAAGRRKTFSTCASHLTVVSLFYGAAIFMYMRPRSTHSPQQDRMISLFYAVITPMVNPMIYSLRNKEVKGAVMRAWGMKVSS